PPGVGAHPERGAALLRRRRRREAPHARPEHGDDVTGAGARHGDRPSDAGADRVEQCCDDRVETFGHPVHDGVGPEVLRLCVAAPKAGWTFDGDVAVHVAEAVPLAALVRARAAGVADAARLEHLHRDTLAAPDAPPAGRCLADRTDHAHRLVPGHEREAGRQVTRVLLVVGAAQPARLDAQQGIVVAGLGDGELASDERARLLEYQRARRPGRHGPEASAASGERPVRYRRRPGSSGRRRGVVSLLRSRSSRNALRSGPPPLLPAPPAAGTTRWHGTTIAMGLDPTAFPTARAAVGFPTSSARAP